MNPIREKLNVYQGASVWGVPSASSFCVKLQFFLRNFDIPYDVKPFNPKHAPRGKMPYINWQGGYLGDSQEIIETLAKKYNLKIDEHLNEHQRYLSHALRRMLEEGTYFNVFHERWQSDDNWRQIKKIFFDDLPPVIRSIVPRIFRRQVLRTLHGQGISRYSAAERRKQRERDLDAVAHLMGDGPYFFGEKASSLDWTVYSIVANVLKQKLPDSLDCTYIYQEKLSSYVKNVERNYFPEYFPSH